MRRRLFNPARTFVALRELPGSPGFEVSGIVVRSLPVLRFRGSGGAVGALTTQTDDILGPGAPNILSSLRDYSDRRFAYLEAQE